MIGVLEGKAKKIRLEEVHRFEHHPCLTPAGPVWDFTGIWLNIVSGLKQAGTWCSDNGMRLASVGVDAWGVDWSLVGNSGELLALPHCYRDPQNEPALEKVLKAVGGKRSLYDRNGIQLMAINSLFQVVARHEREPGLFAAAQRLMFIPDLFHFWLSGELTTERTIASTSAMLALDSGDWDTTLLKQLGLPTQMLGPIIEPGTVIGNLRDEIAEVAGLDYPIQVIAPATHDTASAVAAIPVTDPSKRWAYLSSGTWSLLGAELDAAHPTDAACDAPFTHERGLDGSFRFLKNIGGLWLVQELRRELNEKGESVSFAELTDYARNADPFRTLINPNAARFAAPGKMAAKIREFADETGQPEPETVGDLVRCCLDSLALCYRHTVDLLESILGEKIEVLHVVGGGIQNELLNEITATTMQRPVICGPVEGTAAGNVLVQAMGAGQISDQQEIRQIVARSFETKRYKAKRETLPAGVYEKYQALVAVKS